MAANKARLKADAICIELQERKETWEGPAVKAPLGEAHTGQKRNLPGSAPVSMVEKVWGLAFWGRRERVAKGKVNVIYVLTSSGRKANLKVFWGWEAEMGPEVQMLGFDLRTLG